jgi:hypothetical protein
MGVIIPLAGEVVDGGAVDGGGGEALSATVIRKANGKCAVR